MSGEDAVPAAAIAPGASPAAAADAHGLQGGGDAASARDPAAVASALEFMRVVGRLKGVKRTGWVRSGVEGAESVADHMYRMAMMGFLLGPREGLDSTRCIKLALVHDLGESVVGDLVVEGPKQDRVTRAEKEQMERKAINEICAGVGAPVGEEIRTLWEEFEAGETPEARHVKDLDKFEMVLQADEYERAQGMALPSFFETTAGRFGTPLFRGLDAEVRRRRTLRLQGASGDDAPAEGGAGEGGCPAAQGEDCAAAKRARVAA